jgi:hypothetical protein
LFCCFCGFSLAMAGSPKNATPPHFPRTRGIIQHFERQVRLHTEGLNEDVQVTNERLGQLEATQIDTNSKLATLETSVGEINTSLAGILQRLEEMGRAPKVVTPLRPVMATFAITTVICTVR